MPGDGDDFAKHEFDGLDDEEDEEEEEDDEAHENSPPPPPRRAQQQLPTDSADPRPTAGSRAEAMWLARQEAAKPKPKPAAAKAKAGARPTQQAAASKKLAPKTDVLSLDPGQLAEVLSDAQDDEVVVLVAFERPDRPGYTTPSGLRPEFVSALPCCALPLLPCHHGPRGAP